MGVNPRTGDRVEIRAAIIPKFSSGSVLKKVLNADSEGESDEQYPTNLAEAN